MSVVVFSDSKSMKDNPKMVAVNADDVSIASIDPRYCGSLSVVAILMKNGYKFGVIVDDPVLVVNDIVAMIINQERHRHSYYECVFIELDH